MSRWVPRVELIIGIALIAGVATRAFSLVAAALLLAFSAAVVVNLLRGRDINCGCVGSLSSARISWTLVARDLALAGIALAVVAHPPSALMVPILGQVTEASEVASSDGVAVLVVVVLLVLGDALVVEALRLRRLLTPFAPTQESER